MVAARPVCCQGNDSTGGSTRFLKSEFRLTDPLYELPRPVLLPAVAESLEVAVGINLHDHRNSVIINLAASNLMWKSNFVGGEDGRPSLSLVLERGNVNEFPNDRDLLPCCTTGTFPCSGHPSLLGPSGYLVESVVHPEFELQVHEYRRYPNNSSV